MPHKGWIHPNPTPRRNLRGQTFSRLFVLEGVLGRKPPHWLCQCDCGKWCVVASSNLLQGKQKSCGCLNDEMRKQRTEERRTTPEQKREVHRRACRKYDKKNREKIRQYYQDNREKSIRRSVEWGRKNPEKRRVAIRNYRARNKKRVKGSHTVEDIQRLFNLQRGRCAGCKECLPKSYHVDHVVPQSKGGTNYPINLQLLCGPCNQRKHVKSQIEFMQLMGYLL